MKECKYQKFSDIWPNKCKKFWKKRRQRICKDPLKCTDFKPTLLYRVKKIFKSEAEVKCGECKYLEITLPYGECGKGYRGIVSPGDSCGKGARKE